MPMSDTVLIVEDEPSIADNIAYALSTEGFEVVRTETGAEATEVLSARAISLIVLDVGLPDINGFDFARDIKSRSTVPIIFVTARADEIDRVVGLELGADDYVVKPFSPRELSARVKAVLRRTAAAASAASVDQLSNSAFQVDDGRRVITYHGSALELSRYEFNLLKVLIHSPGRVFTREHLMALVWEDPDMSSERTVDTHIKMIRRKLREIQADEEVIVTHRGVGYSLREDK
jgi:two-component system catabolic regulation response regulator CreB